LYPSQIINTVFCCNLEIQTTSILGYAAVTAALKSILVVSIPRDLEKYWSIINKMMYWTKCNVMDLLNLENINIALED